jgi:ornithine carbamoyltransferase
MLRQVLATDFQDAIHPSVQLVVAAHLEVDIEDRPAMKGSGMPPFGGMPPTPMRNVLTLFELTAAEIDRVFEITTQLKTALKHGVRQPLLAGRVMGCCSKNPRCAPASASKPGWPSWAAPACSLGEDVGWGKREAMSDFARVLSQYVDVLVCRAKAHQTVEDLAEHATCPVINGLTDQSHPCQALADLYTLREMHGELRG